MTSSELPRSILDLLDPGSEGAKIGPDELRERIDRYPEYREDLEAFFHLAGLLGDAAKESDDSEEATASLPPDLEADLREIARDLVAGTGTRPSASPARVVPPRQSRRVVVALAAAAVMLLVASVFVVRSMIDRSEPAPRLDVALRTVGLRGATAAEVFFEITSSVAVHLSILNVDARGQVGFIWTSETHERFDLPAPVAAEAAVTLPPGDRAGAAGFRIDASSEVEHFFVIPTRDPLDANTRAEIESAVRGITEASKAGRSAAVPEILAWLDSRYPGASHVVWRKGG